MCNRKADLVFTDPPFNLKVNGYISGNGSVRHREFEMASGEMTAEEYSAFLNSSISQLARNSTPSAIQYICCDWRHVAEFISVGKTHYRELINLCVWNKNTPGLGSFYRSQHELILVFKNGSGHSMNNVQLGKYGRTRSNIWNYPGANTLSKQSTEGNLLSMHPCVKPVQMIADAILDSSARNNIVLDIFLGSGTTLLAAQRVGRVCYGIEIDPLYVDVTIRRWQRFTGDRAIHVATGRSFDEIAKTQEKNNVE
jgi:DNA modification methylase